MKAVLFGALWLAPGLVLALRRVERPALERGLSLLFWPFFLFTGEPAVPRAARTPTGPLGRLHRALGGDAGATAVVRELQQAISRLEERLARVESALSELEHAGAAPEEGSLAEARRRSASLLRDARDACRTELEAALAAVEETATRLVIARETGSSDEVGELLEALRGRLQAAEEVAACQPTRPSLVLPTEP